MDSHEPMAGTFREKPNTVLDPVCGMHVDPQKARGSADHKEKTYYFCSPRCVERFKAEPEKYLAPKPPASQIVQLGGIAPAKPAQHSSVASVTSVASAPPAPPIPAMKGKVTYVCPMDPEVRESSPVPCPICGMALEPETVEYTCPMHPEVVRSEPGNCPICGMALEPRVALPGTQQEDDSELRSMQRRFWVGLALSIPLLVLSMGGMAEGSPLRNLPMSWQEWLQLALATPVVLWGGWPFFQRGWHSIVNRHLNMFTLIALGTGVAYVYSIVAILFPQIFPAGHPDVYFEVSAFIVTLVLLGQVLELRARRQTSGAIRALLDLNPKTARRLRPDGSEEEIPLNQVRKGDRPRVRPGDRVPVDGADEEGSSAVDESMITGESIPAEKQPRAKVIGGTVNQTGSFIMRAEKLGSETLLAQIVRMAAEAQRSRAPIQSLADKVSGYFVPAVVLVAVLTFIGWMIWGPEPRFAHALVNAVAVLIIACPCALGLATPMAIMVGTGRGAHAGVLIKNAEALEMMEKVDTLVVDKTGTLTEGKPRVVSVITVSGISEPELLRIAATLEQSSEHPLAAAIVSEATQRKVPLAQASRFQSVTGKGIFGQVEGREVAIGNVAFFQELHIDHTEIAGRAEELRQKGQTVMLVAVGGKAAGLVAVADPIKESAREAIPALRESKLRLVMLTGDSPTTAQAIAHELGIDEYEAGVLPERKAEVIKR